MSLVNEKSCKFECIVTLSLSVGTFIYVKIRPLDYRQPTFPLATVGRKKGLSKWKKASWSYLLQLVQVKGKRCQIKEH